MAVLKASQNDMTFAILIVIPLMLLALRQIRPGNEQPAIYRLDRAASRPAVSDFFARSGLRGDARRGVCPLPEPGAALPGAGAGFRSCFLDRAAGRRASALHDPARTRSDGPVHLGAVELAALDRRDSVLSPMPRLAGRSWKAGLWPTASAIPRGCCCTFPASLRCSWRPGSFAFGAAGSVCETGKRGSRVLFLGRPRLLRHQFT